MWVFSPTEKSIPMAFFKLFAGMFIQMIAKGSNIEILNIPRQL